MPLVANLDGDRGILSVAVTGAWPSLQEQSAFRRRIRDSGLVTGKTPVLADLRALEAASAPPWAELHVAMQVPEALTGPRRYALLVTPELRSTAQMMESLAPETVSFRSFTEESEAIAWLLEDPA